MENKPEWLKKALEYIDSLSPEELYESVYGFKKDDFEQYCTDKTYEFEAQYVIDAMNKLGVKEINIYNGDIQPPSNMFFHYLREFAESGTDLEFWNGWGADTLDVPGFNLRYLWVNGQGTEHFFQIIE
ncbi:hypothetical protein SEPL_032 [Salmonella phage SE_PL]|nr:hypothetical protein CPT_Munch_396 [Salmonella phage Munch]QCW19099.1 hypothetical protein 7t3_0581 [Salmonella phage 7t3]QIG62645.1 hypothetical protein SEPL_032 [Salmonella phage SE_PL]WNV47502.1 hypothetical protein [Klebsiella phage fENko-Kae01]